MCTRLKSCVRCYKEMFGINLEAESIALPNQGRANFIQQLIQDRGGARTHWKFDFSVMAASRMTPDDIPGEFVEMLNVMDELVKNSSR